MRNVSLQISPLFLISFYDLNMTSGQSRLRAKICRSCTHLECTTVGDGGLRVMLDGATAGTNSLESLHNIHTRLVSHLAENDVAAVQPRGNHGGDKELGTVAMWMLASDKVDGKCMILTCWGQRWPWKADRACRASAGSSHRRTSRRRWTCRRCPIKALEKYIGDMMYVDQRTLPRVKSPPWSMNSGMMRWKEEPL